MRHKTILVILLLLLCSPAAFTQYQPEWGLTLGGSWLPTYKGGGIDLSAYGRFSSGFMLGASLGFYGTQELPDSIQRAPDDLLDYSVPHGDYHLEGEMAESPLRFNGYLILGKFVHQRAALFGKLGFSMFTALIHDVAQSNVTGWYYSQSSEQYTTAIPAAQIGILYHLTDGDGFLVPVTLAVGYPAVVTAEIGIGGR